MATAQFATAIVKSMKTGRNHIYRVNCSDVATQALTFPDGQGSITFPGPARLVDLIFAATLATTPTLN